MIESIARKILYRDVLVNRHFDYTRSRSLSEPGVNVGVGFTRTKFVWRNASFCISELLQSGSQAGPILFKPERRRIFFFQQRPWKTLNLIAFSSGNSLVKRVVFFCMEWKDWTTNDLTRHTDIVDKYVQWILYQLSKSWRWIPFTLFLIRVPFQFRQLLSSPS